MLKNYHRIQQSHFWHTPRKKHNSKRYTQKKKKERYMHPYAHSTVHKSRDTKTTWTVYIWMDKEDVVHIYRWNTSVQFSSVQFSRSVVSDSLRPHEPQHTRLPCPSPTPGVHSDSCPSSRWCHPAISSSVVPFSSCPQSLPVSESFPIMSQLFALVGQSIGVSASTSVLPKNTQDGSPLGWTGWISLQFKGLSRVFSNATVQKYQFFGAQLSL